MPDGDKGGSQNNDGRSQNNDSKSTGYSSEYVKELRDEAAGWRTKLRDTEDRLNKLTIDIENSKKQSTVSEILSQRGAKGVKPSWIEVEEDGNAETAVDNFLKEYPQFTQKDEFVPNSQKKNRAAPPMKTQRDNSNIENTEISELSAIKKDPIARAKLRDLYRGLLAQNSSSKYEG